MTLSMGVSTWPMAPASTCEELVSDADKVMYFAKNNDRNHVALNDSKSITRFTGEIKEG